LDSHACSDFVLLVMSASERGLQISGNLREVIEGGYSNLFTL